MKPEEQANATQPLGVMVDTLAGEVRDHDRNQVFATSENQRCAIRQERENYWEGVCAAYYVPSGLTLEQFNNKIEQNNQEILRKFGHK